MPDETKQNASELARRLAGQLLKDHADNAYRLANHLLNSTGSAHDDLVLKQLANFAGTAARIATILETATGKRY